MHTLRTALRAFWFLEENDTSATLTCFQVSLRQASYLRSHEGRG